MTEAQTWMPSDRQDGMRRLATTLTAREDSLKCLAEHLGLRRQSVYNWTVVPLEWLRATVDYSALEYADLRPDLVDFVNEQAEELGLEVNRVNRNGLIKMLALHHEMEPRRRRGQANARAVDGRKNGIAGELAAANL